MLRMPLDTQMVGTGFSSNRWLIEPLVMRSLLPCRRHALKSKSEDPKTSSTSSKSKSWSGSLLRIFWAIPNARKRWVPVIG